MPTNLTKDERADYCPRCKEFRLYPSACQCKRFECGEPFKDQVEDWHEVYATDAQEAAEKCAERFDCEGDYTIIRHGSGELWTRNEDGEIEKWFIEAESVPTYRASIKR